MNENIFWPDKGDELVSKSDAFRGMVRFVFEYWRMRGSPAGELGDLLANVVTLDDGAPADRGVWREWLDAIDHNAPPEPD